MQNNEYHLEQGLATYGLQPVLYNPPVKDGIDNFKGYKTNNKGEYVTETIWGPHKVIAIWLFAESLLIPDLEKCHAILKIHVLKVLRLPE